MTLANGSLRCVAGALIVMGIGWTQAPAVHPVARPDADECAVWHRELSFAQSLENHDGKAFAAFIHPGAVFDAGTALPTRGREAVLKEWAPLIEGKELRVRWRPDVVNIGGDRNIAISRGPFTIEDTRAAAQAQFRVGTFSTIWVRRSAKEEWVVLFDGAGAAATPVKTREAAEEFMSHAAAGERPPHDPHQQLC